MAETLGTISEALQLIETKKENLKKAFDELQSQSSSFLSSSFSLSWSDLDSHFTSIQNSLTHKFNVLQSLQESLSENLSNPQIQIPKDPSSSSAKPQTRTPNDPSSSSAKPQTRTPNDPSSSSAKPQTQTPNNPSSSSAKPQTQTPKDPSPSALPDPDNHNRVDHGSNGASELWPELIALCENMDGLGLRKYVNATSKDRDAIRAELPGAIRRAPDPGALVLDAMEGFYRANERNKGDRDLELGGVRRSCLVLLEVLMGISPNVGFEARERAKKLAMEWKGHMSKDGENPLEVLGLLHLVVSYGLVSEFNMDELIDYIVTIGKHRQTMDLCRKLGLGDKVSDLIHKLINQGKQLLAVKFVFEFQLTGKFPPVPLLKEYLKESTELAKKVCHEGKNSLKSLNEATAKEVGAMRSVIKVIEDYKLESEYPPGILEKQIEHLEKQKAGRKRPAAKQQQVNNQKQKQQQVKNQKQQQQVKNRKQQQQQSGNKRPRTDAPVGLVAAPKSYGTVNSTVSSYQHSHLRSTGLLPDGPAPHVSSSAPYGMSGLTPPVAPYVGSSAGLYGLAGAPMGFSVNSNAGGSFLCSSSEPYVNHNSGYYDMPTAYGGYGVPSQQYHPAYYPQ